MKRIIAALQVSMDGFIEGPGGYVDWIEAWEDPFAVLSEIDACILGRRTYEGYEPYWSAVAANPNAALPSGRLPTRAEITYAEFALRTPHFVLSRTLDRVNWRHTKILRGIDEVRALKGGSGKAIHAVGGAALVGTLLNAGLVDEVRLVVRPLLLGEGKPLFEDVRSRHSFGLQEATALPGDSVRLRYVPAS